MRVWLYTCVCKNIYRAREISSRFRDDACLINCIFIRSEYINRRPLFYTSGKDFFVVVGNVNYETSATVITGAKSFYVYSLISESRRATRGKRNEEKKIYRIENPTNALIATRSTDSPCISMRDGIRESKTFFSSRALCIYLYLYI